MPAFEPLVIIWFNFIDAATDAASRYTSRRISNIIYENDS